MARATRCTFLTLLTALLLPPPAAMYAAEAAHRPNIIVFVTDDQVKEELGCYGGRVLTPHIDRLAREGMRFENAHVPSTVCTPSRYTLLTGRYPGNSYFKPYLADHPRDRQGNPGFNVGLEDDNMNVGNLLRGAGYVTALVGKLHVGPELKRREDYEAFGLYYPDPKADPDSPEVIVGWQRNERWFRQWVRDRGFSWAKHNYWGNIQAPYNKHNAEWTLSAALEFIEENKQQPFYLHYTTTLMHGGGRAWSDSLNHPLVSGAGKLAESPGGMPPRQLIRQQVADAGFAENTVGFTWMDASVGAMLDALDRLGIAENTLFVFVSDHGTEGKWTLHDHNGTAVPCIMRWPKVIPAKTVSQSLIQTTDFVPTFFDVAGVEPPADYRIDGTSLRPVLVASSHRPHEHLFFELGNARGVRTEDWKYIAIRYDTDHFRRIQSADLLRLPRALAYIGNDKTLSNNLGRRPHMLDSDQLYHLADDPLETTNLAGSQEHAKQLSKMKSLLSSELKKQGRPFGEFVPAADSVPVDRLQPYLQQLTKLKPIKRGFEVIGEEPKLSETPMEGASRQQRKQMREERRKRGQTDVKASP